MVKDHASGYSKGFGFIKYATIEEAAAGIKGMDGQVSSSTFRVHLLSTLSLSQLKKW